MIDRERGGTIGALRSTAPATLAATSSPDIVGEAIFGAHHSRGVSVNDRTLTSGRAAARAGSTRHREM
eukprot:scaffold3808_cov112-Isochrysis_galbana.AAC.5